MNEIALANFYRVLNNSDRFPKEKELAEAAIAAKDELNSLRAHQVAEPASLGAEAAAREIIQSLKFSLTDPVNPKDIASIISKHLQHQPIGKE